LDRGDYPPERSCAKGRTAECTATVLTATVTSSALALEQTDSRPASREMTHQEKMDVVIQQFNLHADFGNIPRSELKQHVCDELNIAQRTANKLIKDVVDLKILKVDGRSIVEGANYEQN